MKLEKTLDTDTIKKIRKEALIVDLAKEILLSIKEEWNRTKDPDKALHAGDGATRILFRRFRERKGVVILARRHVVNKLNQALKKVSV